jgi:hypothetical protein
MGLSEPPTQDRIQKNGLFPQTWILWFDELFKESEKGHTGTFTNADGDTVTVVNGKITDVS